MEKNKQVKTENKTEKKQYQIKNSNIQKMNEYLKSKKNDPRKH